MKYKTLIECYKSPSTAKQTIYKICCKKALLEGATDYGILGYNCSFFTFGYTKPNGDIVIITPSRFYSLCKGLY